MPPKAPHNRSFQNEEDGGVLVFFAMALVVFFGFLALVFDFGRMAMTQSELQAYADSVALAAAGELDQRSDSIDRAQAAAAALISDTENFSNAAGALGPNDYTLTFHSFLPETNAGALVDSLTTNPLTARFVQVQMADRSVDFGFGALHAALSGGADRGRVNASAVAGFELVACGGTPIVMCLPDIDFSAEASIGRTVQLGLGATVSQMSGGGIGALATKAGLKADGEACAGLQGRDLVLCVSAASEPGAACYGQGGIGISAEVTVADIAASLNVRFGQFSGAQSSKGKNAYYLPAPNVLAGETNNGGHCVDLNLGASVDVGLPMDDCIVSGACIQVGDGDWSQGREAYVDAHYGGVDPHPEAVTRYDFYVAEVEANASLLDGLTGAVGAVGGVIGGLTRGGKKPLAGLSCNPYDSDDTSRRLLTIAAVDCSDVSGSVGNTQLHVREYFEAFLLGATQSGKVALEVEACLGGNCGPSHSGVTVRDVVRLYR